jgi:hypothetical protein
VVPPSAVVTTVERSADRPQVLIVDAGDRKQVGGLLRAVGLDELGVRMLLRPGLAAVGAVQNEPVLARDPAGVALHVDAVERLGRCRF